ncbi:SL659 acyltransferase papA1 [Mycobacterium persicum]|uniref:SL659 acyltransferase papA1 n=1 Tax=Mycobacterium persicum TaxID=1487726 RepID=A0AB38US88_9MYCO|nr:SL659 acyltransferase papA1 [Mycobacterium persicum]
MVVVGNLGLDNVRNWLPEPGVVWLWQPSPATVANARDAPISAVPPSYIQARHLRRFAEQTAKGLDMSRLLVIAFDMLGHCDIRTMTYVINAHLRRHDTYRSRFAISGARQIVRHTMTDPGAIEMQPVERGVMTPNQWQEYILSTPSPLDWDCFRFGVIQHDDHFTVCISIDHIHFDATFLGTIFLEIREMYNTLMDGGEPIPLSKAGSYAEYCLREHAYTSTLTLDSPEVRQWIEFLENNDGSFPAFPLPLGDTSRLTAGEVLSLQLLDAHQTADFEAACTRAGVRFSGGVFACAALTEYELAGAETYYAVTPTGTRSTPAEFVTSGWFIGHLPLAVPVGDSFGETARGAQAAFDSRAHLARVPFERVLELAPRLAAPLSRGCFPMLSFLDAGVPPLSAVFAPHIRTANTRVFSDGRIAARVCMWVNRFHEETTVTASFPDSPIAHESVRRYLEAMKSVYVRVAEGRGDVRQRRATALSFSGNGNDGLFPG